MKNPPHPADFIRTEIIQPAGLSVTAAAAALLVSRPALSSLLNRSANLSGDMALRIEKAFGVKMDTLMRMQASYDIAQTPEREKKIRVRRIHTPKTRLEEAGADARARLGSVVRYLRIAWTQQLLNRAFFYRSSKCSVRRMSPAEDNTLSLCARTPGNSQSKLA
jgi:addiction module HigA family antidote